MSCLTLLPLHESRHPCDNERMTEWMSERVSELLIVGSKVWTLYYFLISIASYIISFTRLADKQSREVQRL
jgi:hypothetical protein